ncbi:unnamed protein product [Boreogadus saida]
METHSAAGDVDSVHGGLSSVDPLVERILEDTVCQQQGWLRVYGKEEILSFNGNSLGWRITEVFREPLARESVHVVIGIALWVF